jgi:hypothetical protein
VFLGKLLDEFVRLVEGTDVAHLYHSRLTLIEPSKRISLGPAHVGTVLVDPAGTLVVEKSARPLGMRTASPQQICMMSADVLRFDLEDGDVIHAAGCASETALEALGVDHIETGGLRVNIPIELRKLPEQLLGFRVHLSGSVSDHSSKPQVMQQPTDSF